MREDDRKVVDLVLHRDALEYEEILEEIEGFEEWQNSEEQCKADAAKQAALVIGLAVSHLWGKLGRRMSKLSSTLVTRTRTVLAYMWDRIKYGTGL